MNIKWVVKKKTKIIKNAENFSTMNLMFPVPVINVVLSF